LSAGVRPLQPEVARLLELCQGQGAVVAVVPAGSSEHHPPHHFYAGVARAPALSFLEALLLALGGDLPDGSRRYDEIVVANANLLWNENGLDKPPQEILHFNTPAGVVERGNSWSTWWYRKPASLDGEEKAEEPSPGDRPDPLAGGGRLRRGDWKKVGRKEGSQDVAAAFPVQIPLREKGTLYPQRHRELRQIVETLEARPHRTLLLLEMAVLDYPTLDSAPHDHGDISEEGIAWMSWLPSWINLRAPRSSRLDVVFYSRNRQRVDAFLGGGLPRCSGERTGKWRTSSYDGKNLERIEYPWGSHPWGADVFTGDPGFEPQDGTHNDSPQGRQSYPNRTLRALLRGAAPSGEVTKIRFNWPRPIPPQRPAEPRDLIDRGFWSQVDLPVLRQALAREYFGAEANSAVAELLATLELMQESARSINSPQKFHDAVADRWRRASTLLLWGEGGTGKTYLGKILSDLIFGDHRDPFPCEQSAGGNENNPGLGFKARVFGSPPGYIGSERLTSVGRQFFETRGFTVMIFDEIQTIQPGDFGAGMKALYDLVFERKYLPENSALTHDRPISLWNTLFVLTANLPSFPPPGVAPQDQKAITRRVSAHEVKLLRDEEVAAFAQWHLPRAVQFRLGGVAVCTCDDLTRELGRLRLHSRSLDELRNELEPTLDRVMASLRARDVTPSQAPLTLDITDSVRKAIA
jgi:hypothetical protein